LKLLLDEMYPGAIADQLRAQGYDVISVHDYSWLEGSSDEEVLAAAVAEGRAVVTENVPDFCRLEANALARGESHAGLIFTTNRQFPRGDAAIIGRMVMALSGLLQEQGELSTTIFLKPPR
jgi:predicted nuclease of predicted toxin-antitoxin system